jgi:mono/diheme cytochrome c family protein
MRRLWVCSLGIAGLLLTGDLVHSYAKQRNTPAKPAVGSAPITKLRAARQSLSDLEAGGAIAGLPPEATRYITREDLLALPQVSYTVADDSNFTSPTKITGVSLEELTRSLGAAPQSDMVVAICDDKYRANYPRDYVAAHHPLLVLTVDGKPPSGWPKSSDGQGYDMGPYMISHPKFTPSFKTLSHSDEPQIPWGVVRIELRDENAVLAAIAPREPRAATPVVKAGFRIAQQNCFRCHNMGREGGQKSGTPWPVLSAWARASPEYFAAYVRNPQTKNPHAQMPGTPGYDDATIAALTAYFRTFVSSGAGSTWSPPREGKP